MKENRWRMGQTLTMVLLTLIFLSTSLHASTVACPCKKTPAKPPQKKCVSEPQKPKPALTILAVQSPEGVSEGCLLVMTGSQDGTFALQPGDNEIIFPTKDNKTVSVKAESVTPDGRVLGVLVPSQAQSGLITVKKGTQELEKINIKIKPASGFQWNAGAMVGAGGLLLLSSSFLLFSCCWLYVRTDGSVRLCRNRNLLKITRVSFLPRPLHIPEAPVA